MASSKVAAIVLAMFLTISALMNAFLVRRLFGLYRESQLTRLDPASLWAHRADNAEFLRDPAREPFVVLFGDSRISQWQPMPSIPGCRVINRGVSSQTTALLLLRLDQDLLRLQPRAAIVQAGINDLKLIGTFPDRKELIVESCWKNMRELVKRIEDADIQVFLLTVFPTGPVGIVRRSIWPDDIEAAINDINERMVTLSGPRVVVIDCDPVLMSSGTMRGRYAKDTLHLTPPAYEALNRWLTPRLGDLVQDHRALKDSNALQ